MEEDFKKISKILEEQGQGHILSFWNELNTKEKEKLILQIKGINFEEIKELYEKSYQKEFFSIQQISPMPYIDKLKLSTAEKEKYVTIGENIIKRGKLAVVSMAGGQRNTTRI